MSKGKIEIIETCCRRCGKSIRTLSHTIIGADDAREKFGSICGGCITPEEDNGVSSRNGKNRTLSLAGHS